MTVSISEKNRLPFEWDPSFILDADEMTAFLKATGVNPFGEQDSLFASIAATVDANIGFNTTTSNVSTSSSEDYEATDTQDQKSNGSSLADFSWIYRPPEFDRRTSVEDGLAEALPKGQDSSEDYRNTLEKDSNSRINSRRKRSKAKKKKSIKHRVNELVVDNVKRAQKKVLWTKPEEQRVSFWYGHFVQQKVDGKGISAAVASKMASEGFPKRPGKEYNNKWRRQLRPGLRVLAQYEWTSDDIRALKEHVAEFGARKWGTFTEKTNIPDHLARYKWIVLTKKKHS